MRERDLDAVVQAAGEGEAQGVVDEGRLAAAGGPLLRPYPPLIRPRFKAWASRRAASGPHRRSASAIASAAQRSRS